MTADQLGEVNRKVEPDFQAQALEYRLLASVYGQTLKELIGEGLVRQDIVESRLIQVRDAALTDRKFRRIYNGWARKLGINEESRSRGFVNFAVNSATRIRGLITGVGN